MSGFSGILLFNKQLSEKLKRFSFPEKLHGYYTNSYQVMSQDFSLRCYNNGKFSRDALVLKNDDRLLGFDGINLMKTKFEEIIDFTSFVNTIGTLKGAFTCVYKEEKKQQIALFADHTGSKQIFYYWNSSFFAFSSSIFLLTDVLRHFDVQLTISIPASYMILSLGYLLEDYTLVSEIKKVQAGHYVSADRTGMKIQKYHDYYRNIMYNKLTKELLVELNGRFKRSIELEYEKDKEYGFTHIATLSGGLDSRLNVMFAHQYGYKDITCLTFGEGFKSDELTARKISGELALKHTVLLLNKGCHLYDVETPLILNNCSAYYFGSAQALAAAKQLNFSAHGLLHNGILAESSKGTYLAGKEHSAPELDRHFRISEQFFNRLDTGLLTNIFQKYNTHEMFITYNRGFNAAHNGSWVAMPFTDSVYTYMDLDFAELAYSIHPKLRYRGFLTVEWIKKLNLEACNFPWQRGIKPTNNQLRILLAKVYYRLKLVLTQKHDISFPFNEWFSANPHLFEFVKNVFDSTSSWEIIPNEIRKDMRRLILNCSVEEKLLCISYLKSIELIFVR